MESIWFGTNERSDVVPALVMVAKALNHPEISAEELSVIDSIVKLLKSWRDQMEADCQEQGLSAMKKDLMLFQADVSHLTCLLQLRCATATMASRKIPTEEEERIIKPQEEEEVVVDSPGAAATKPKAKDGAAISQEATASSKKCNIMPPECHFCAERHFLYQCSLYEQVSPKQRVRFAKEEGLCYNCFCALHSTTHCPKPPSCRRCGGNHHSKLHAGLV